MDKQEAIKKAWGDQYPPDGVDDNGWSKKEFKYGEYNVSDFDAKMYLCGANIRPKELRGIENNNGWIKIETEEDLPLLSIEYHVLKNGSLTTAYYCKNNRWIIDENSYPKTTEIHKITHYQEIVKPKPPIY